ncbi:hypothetical protein ASPCAL11539 [Aspergillus calidoustus]|uniref:Uncharacterized protein n=1 Tax=Aspergillus calidoustus TaxID=454130 RepID=A0A0U5H3F1_ASPCI|nr:hypothetical protein ASPCAL11539 [Aspergillus calidoustus]
MDSPQQRLTFVSMCAFEDIGRRELETELCRELPQANLHYEYAQGEEVFVVKGKLEGLAPLIANLVSAFIEKQRKSKDLLDTPRIRQLALPSAARDKTNTMELSDAAVRGGLLALDDDPATLIPHQMTRVTKFWLASAGGVGCFAANNYRDMLKDIAKGTGTEIIVPDDLKGIQVSGPCTNDVDDAMAKLSEIEKPLSYICRPAVGNIDICPGEQDTRYVIQPATHLNSASIGRILTDTTPGSFAQLGQMFVTASYIFDEDAQRYTAPRTLLQPPKHGSEITKTRLWNDFTFQEVGSGDEFSALDSAIDTNQAESRLVPSGITGPHPFLSPEKAKQVNQWVADGESMEAPSATQDAGPEIHPEQSSCLGSPRIMPANLEVKRKPGIKVRRPAQHAQTSTAQDTKILSPQVETGSITNTSRKKWRMTWPNNGINGSRIQSPATDEIAESIPPYPGSKSPSPPFDDRKYGLNKKSAQSKKAVCKLSPVLKKKPPTKKDELIDVTSGETINVNPQLLLGLEAPGLVPNASESSNVTGNSGCDDSSCPSMVQGGTHVADLLGLDFNENEKSGESASSISLQQTSSSKGSFADQAARLQSLNDQYSSYSVTVGSNSVRPRTRPGHTNRLLENRVIEQYERLHRPETEQPVSEARSRQFHHTMSQKTARPGPKTMTKAVKQATLMAAWGIPERQKAANGSPQGQNGFVVDKPKPNKPQISEREQEKQRVQKQREEAQFHDDLGRFFAAIKPPLEAAESFPGTITFEIQIGLIFIPDLPKTVSRDKLISPGEWSSILQPQNGVMAPTTKFVNRVTVSGADVDHIIDLRRSKAEGRSRIFEQDYSEYNVSYEFHCTTKMGESLIVVLDEQGKYTVQKPNSMLGAVNIHFPRQIWDARAIIGSITEYRLGTNLEFEEAAKYLVDHVRIPAENHIHIVSSLPEGNKLAIENVFMKRWTHHRFVCLEEASCDPAKSSNGGGQVDASERNEVQDIFLRVTEVQDLVIVRPESSIPQRVSARYTNAADMIHRGKMWYEISLVSPALDTILSANTRLEIGERTEDWRAADLLGEYAALLTEDASNSAVSSVAAAIGASGIGNLFELAKAIVPKIDGVGYFNPGPITAEVLQVTAGGSDGPKGKSFEELDSVKEVESVAARLDPSVHNSAAAKRERFELDYW